MISSEINLKSEIRGLPSLIQVIPFGSHKTEKGDFILDEKSAEAIVYNFNSHANDMVIDYEHQTLKGVEAPAAGWIKKLINKGKDGVWAVVEWTDRAKEYLKNKEYRYLSPVFLKRLSDNKVIHLINAGLTNQPAIDGMVPLVNKRKEVSMGKLLEVLGLNPDTNEDEAISAVQALKSQAHEISNLKSEIISALGLKDDATLSEVTGTVMALKSAEGQAGEISNLKSQISSLKAEMAKRDAENLIAGAMKEGKVTPAQKDWASAYAERDPEGFKVFIAKAPVIVQTGEIAGSGTAGVGSALEEVQMAVNKALGISEETFKKHNKEV